MSSVLNSTLLAICGLFPVLRRIVARQSGAFFGALWVRPMKTRAGVSAIVTKEVRATVRAGISHDARQSVQDARESGEAPAQNAGLPWGAWSAFPYVISHKGENYVRLYPVPDSRPRVRYRIDGKPASREQVEQLCIASEFRESSACDCYTLNLRNLRRVSALAIPEQRVRELIAKRAARAN